MAKNKFKENYLKAIVIAHGKSEKQMCEFIKQNLRLNIHIESDRNGEKSIQITSLMNILTNTKYKNYKSFIKCFGEQLGINGRKVMLSKDFKIFIIMDTDDCTTEQKNKFINKGMFENHWAYDYIYPIYNTENLEDVMEDIGIKFKSKGNDRKKEYIKIFPTDRKYKRNDAMQIKDFCESLQKSSKTNMNEFVEFCLNIA